MKELGNLNGKMDGMVKQQMITNGKVAEHDGRLNRIDVEDGKIGMIITALQEAQGEDMSEKKEWIKFVFKVVINAVLVLAILVLARTGIINLSEKTPNTPQAIQEKVIDLRAETEKLKANLEQ